MLLVSIFIRRLPFVWVEHLLCTRHYASPWTVVVSKTVMTSDPWINTELPAWEALEGILQDAWYMALMHSVLLSSPSVLHLNGSSNPFHSQPHRLPGQTWILFCQPQKLALSLFSLINPSFLSVWIFTFQRSLFYPHPQTNWVLSIFFHSIINYIL